ncbi:MAG: MBL fold metallo-hydrolase [Bacteroidales bacterium]|nr:MBL fold metallo-hydrolase [Bacteroidales bacterium]
MKKSFFFAAAMLMVLLLSGCHSKATKPPLNEEDINMAGITCYSAEGYTIFAITDKETEQSVELFKGSYDDSLLATLAPAEGFKSAINVFLVSDGEHYWLFDTGLGSDAGGVLSEKLSALGVRPEGVEAIFLTHLHPDHIGGLLRGDIPLYPNATIYLSVDEFDAWSTDGVMKGMNEQWLKVLSYYALQVAPFNDGDTLLGAVVAHLAPGHTPGHTVFQLDNHYFVGDLFHAQDLQLEHPEFCARYDADSQQAVATRKVWLGTFGEALQPKAVFSGAHAYQPFLEATTRQVGDDCTRAFVDALAK